MTPRIVSLLPSCTEIVAALGLECQLVGRSHECDYPPSIFSLPVCTKLRLDPSRPSGEIHEQMAELNRQSLSPYVINLPLLSELKPDVILTQAQCDVCAVSFSELEAAVKEKLDYSPVIVALNPSRLSHLWDNMNAVADAVEANDEQRARIKALKMRLVDVIEKVAEVLDRPRVGCIEWTDPLMVAGNWVPDIVEIAGGKAVFGEAGKHSPRISWATLLNQDPEILVVMACGFDLDRTLKEAESLKRHVEWLKLRAVKNKRVYAVDGNGYFNRPGPRLIDSVEILAELLHPGKFNFSGRGKSWERLS